MKHQRRKRFCAHSKEQPFLVGFSGKIKYDRRLFPLRKTAKYKRWLEQEELTRHKRTHRISELTERYKNMSQLILNLQIENKNSVNESLIKELTYEMRELRDNIANLKSHLCMTRDNVKTIKEERSFMTRGSTIHNVARHEKKIVSLENFSAEVRKATSTVDPFANSLPGKYESQINVKDKNSVIRTVKIDLFSSGENLLKILEAQFGLECNRYRVRLRKKQLDRERSLFHQGVFHDTTIRLNTEFKEQRNIGINEHKELARASSGSGWISEEVVGVNKSVFESAQIFAHDTKSNVRPINVDLSANGTALIQVLCAEFGEEIRGLDVLHGSTKIDFTSSLLDQGITHGSTIVFNRRVLGGMDNENASRENVVKNSSDSGNRRPERWTKAQVVKWIDSICEEYEIEKEEVSDLKRSNGKGLDLLKKEDWLRRSTMHGDMLYELWRQLKTERSDSPKQPDIVFPEEKRPVMSIEEEKPSGAKPTAQNESQSEAKVDYSTSFPEKIGPSTSAAVGGRVQNMYLEPDPTRSRSPVVLDSEVHPLLYVEKEPSPPSSETSSQQDFTHLEIFQAKVDGELLSVNSNIKKTNRRVFLPVTTSFDEIRKNAVALKNSFDGDIFVGVESSGKVSGRSLVQEDLVKWREQMAIKIGAILPGTDDQVCFCKSYHEAAGKIGKECFISIMKLGNSRDSELGIIWIHVTRGQEKVYFSKATDVPAFVRVGAETKRMTNYKELFSLLESLKYRAIRPSCDFETVYKEARSNMASRHTYKLFKTKKAESHEREFKMVFSQDPVKKIVEEYVPKYCCGFLNSHSGTIYCGVQEDEDTKEGLVVGIVLPDERRDELLRKSIEVLQGFYPPVDFSQICIRFITVVIPFTSVLKYQDGDNNGEIVLLQGPGDEIGRKWPRFIRSIAEKIPNTRARVIRINSESFCIVGENLSASENFIDIVRDFQKSVKKSSLKSIKESDFEAILKDLCVVEIRVAKSMYPVHLTKPLDTHIFDSNGNLISLSYDELIRRFEMNHEFNIDEFLNDVNNFDPAGNSYIMISSPFNLPPLEQDIFGLVIPNWTLAIDFDQDPKNDGHLFHLFEKLHDGCHRERDRCLVTPQSDKLDLNADHGICWLAARGHRAIADSLSRESEGKNTWNTTHRKMITTLLNAELTRNVMPSKIHVVIFWDTGYKSLSYSLNLLLADILSICDNTSVTFVCSTSEAHSDIDKDVKLLKENCTISNESNVHIAPLHVLAKHLAVSLPETFRPEDDYQVPKKQYTENTSLVTVPTVLPQRLRQNIHGRLKMMYINKSRNVDEKKLEEERKKFYTGSQITMFGLRGNIGIEREKLKELDEAFQDLNNDKSRVSLIIVKADRGAGTTTMCLQFLYKHHEKIPCAQLIEIHRDLLSFIEKINQITNLPLLLLVDEEVGNLQDFLDFKKDAENRRTVNIIFLLVEPVQIDRKPAREGRQGKHKRQRRFGDRSLYGTSCYRDITLKRELEKAELEKLSFELLKICPDDAREKVTDLKERALFDKSRALRSFAYFSLTAFGKEFSDLSDYVKFRLQLATDLQKELLAFLSLTHQFTGHKLPASALARYLDKDKVNMKSEFQNVYLQEMLSPPAQETDSRRISFVEVANEILIQLAEESEIEEYWLYIKHIAVEMARKVLSVNIGASKIDRLTRKLFIISEYESEKFSSLIRSMRYAENADTARDTLLDLVEVFRKHISFRAHLLAHLAKYYMIEYSDFQNAKSRIEEAVKDVPDDALLHHIHGDIIRHYIDNLKSEETVNMSKIVPLAIESSSCFLEVRERRPQMNHGYVSDALVQITVMQACIKSVRSDKEDYGFVEYLIQMIEDVKTIGKLGEQEKYLLALITSAHEYLNESGIEYGHKEKLRKKFNECIPKETELKILCEKLEAERRNFSGQKAWIDAVRNRTYSLFLQLEIENNKDMSPEDFELRIKQIEDGAFDEGSMKYWFRFVRKIRTVPTLTNVEKRVKQWIGQARKMNITSPHAEFYNYVVAVLIALKDPNDDQKMQRAADLVKKQQRNKHATDDSRKIPNTLEWLCPKQGSHVNSIDSLLLNDDLLKDSYHKGKEISLKERLENCLRKKNVSRWEGAVDKIRNDWHGTIKFRGYIDVYFLPQSIRSSKPAIGDTVSFHLSFDWHGPRAWSVERVAEITHGKSSYLSDSGTEDNDIEKESQATGYNAPRPLYSVNLEDDDREENTWSHYVDKQMIGVVTKQKEGYGFCSHPDVEDSIFFHLNDVSFPPDMIRPFMILRFRVHLDSHRNQVRAVDIRMAQESDINSRIMDYKRQLNRDADRNTRGRVTDGEQSRFTRNPSRVEEDSLYRDFQKGTISKFFSERGYGFIRADNLKDRVFFLRDQLLPGVDPSPNSRVIFLLSRNQEGYIARKIDTEQYY